MVWEAPRLPLSLTGREVVFLTDAVGNGDVALGLPEKETYRPLGRELLLLLGSAYCELVDGNFYPPKIAQGPVDVYVSEEHAWLLRSKVTTGAVAIDNEPIGAVVLVKLYNLLMRFNSAKLEPGLEDLDTVDGPEPTLDDIRKRIQEFRYARPDPSPGQDADDDTVPPAADGAGLGDRPAEDLPGAEGEGHAGGHSLPTLGPLPQPTVEQMQAAIDSFSKYVEHEEGL